MVGFGARVCVIPTTYFDPPRSGSDPLQTEASEEAMSQIVLSEKRCTRCGEIKPLSEFYNDASASDGKARWCKLDQKAWQKDYQRRIRSELGEDEYKALVNARVRKYRSSGNADGRDRIAYGNAMNELRRRHPDEFLALLRQKRYDLGLNPDSRRQGP